MSITELLMTPTITSLFCIIIGTIILIWGFTRKGLLLKTLGGGLTLGGTVFLFVNDETFRTILTAAAGVVVAVAVTFSLLQNTQLRKDTKERELRDRREALLNEITDWARSIVNWRSQNRTATIKMASIEQGQNKQSLRLYHAHIAEILDFFSALTGLNKYVTEISLIFQQGLPEDINKLRNDLEVFIVFLEKWKTKVFNRIDTNVPVLENEDIDTAEELTQRMTESAVSVLGKVASIKVKEIGS